MMRITSAMHVPLDGVNEDKARLIEKFKLVPKKINIKLYLVRQFGNRPDHPYETHRAVVRCSPLELVFSLYDL